MKLDPDCKLVMIGDSITDCGHALQAVDGSPEALGNGYVSFVQDLLTACYPELRIQVVNSGLSGNTVRDLRQRWQADVIDLKPDWLSIFIGINDVWRHFDTPILPGWQVPIEEYQQTLDELLEQTKPLVEGVILMTPYYLEPNLTDPMRRMMDNFGLVVKQLAEKHHSLLVDTQAAFDRVMRYVSPLSLAVDRVHPGTAGHMVLARAFLQAIDFDWTRA